MKRVDGSYNQLNYNSTSAQGVDAPPHNKVFKNIIYFRKSSKIKKNNFILNIINYILKKFNFF